jgi:hypothetical protein
MIETINCDGGLSEGIAGAELVTFQNFAELEKCIREGVASHMRKSRSTDAELDKLKREMAAHDGPPTKEEIEKSIHLKYGSDAVVTGWLGRYSDYGSDSPITLASTPGALAKGANFSSDEGGLTSASIGF